jgi:hypothetical protein
VNLIDRLVVYGLLTGILVTMLYVAHSLDKLVGW